MNASYMTAVRREIVAIIDKILGEEYLLLVFGSVARGNIDKMSDIDLALYRAEKIPAKIFVEIKETLNETAHTLRDIDVVNLTDKTLNRDLIENIFEEGVVWKHMKNSKGNLNDLKKHLINTKK